ncbi:MAG TPA: hypothetical protein VK665_18340, partial [Candidatus Elarobacter sp.]|nr:hypothetical protein [Candidatus Elarobacter sp.]
DRGEFIAQSFSPNPIANGFSTWPAFQYQSVQGVIVQTTSEQWDGRTGAVISLGAPLTYDAIGRMTQFSSGLNGKTFAYDAENRLISGSTDQVQASGNCGSGRTIQGARAGGNGGYTYGPDGNIIQSVDVGVDLGRTTNNWHWIGDMPLYRDASSVVGYINADNIGVLPPGGGTPNLTVFDRQLDGLITSRHNSTGHAAWAAPNPFLQKCVEQNPAPASPGYTDPTLTLMPDTPDGSTLDDGNSTISPSGRGWVAGTLQSAAGTVNAGRAGGARPRRVLGLDDPGRVPARAPGDQLPPPPPPPPPFSWDPFNDIDQQAQELWADLWAYNYANGPAGGMEPFQSSIRNPANIPLVKNTVLIGTAYGLTSVNLPCASSVSFNGGFGTPHTVGYSVTSDGQRLLTSGVAEGGPVVSGSVVYTFGAQNAPGAGNQITGSAFFGVGGDVSLDLASGGLFWDVGAGTPQAGIAVTTTVPAGTASSGETAGLCGH